MSTHVPVRTCVGCGRRSSPSDLVRLVVREGALTVDAARQAPGRGAYTCPRATCFERAVERGAFARSLRTTVTVPDGLNRLVEDV